MKKSTIWLAILGLVSGAVYVTATLRLPWWRYGKHLHSWLEILGGGAGSLIACLVGAGVLVAAYLAGWWIVRRHPADGQRWVVWGGALTFTLTLLWLMPITSDLFTYLSQAHLFTDWGLNPAQVAPIEMQNDPLILAFPTRYVTLPAVYGPSWLLLSAPGTLGANDVVVGVFYLKGLAAFAFLGSAWLLERIRGLQEATDAVESLYLWAWNPLLLLMAVGDGHNDVVMMALVLLSLWLVARPRPQPRPTTWLAFGTPILGALALSAWIKYVSAIYIPLTAIHLLRAEALKGEEGQHWRKGWPVLIGGALVILVVSALILLPIWIVAGGGVDGLLSIAGRVLRPANWQGGASDVAFWGFVVGLGLFALAYLVVAWRLARGPATFQRLANAAFTVSLLAFILGAARSQPWHLIWPAALAGLSDRRWAWPLVAALSILMLGVQIWVEWGAPGW